MKRTIYDCWKCRHHNSDNPYGIDYCDMHDTRCSFAHDDCDNFEPTTGGNDLTDEERMKTGCLHVVAFIVTGIVAMLLCALFAGCTTTKYVPVVEHRTDTLMKYSTIRDSIYLSDSIYVSDFVRDDTVYKTVDRWHTRYVERTRTDTLYRSATDTVTVVYDNIKQVPAQLSWWQQTRLHMANIMLYLLAIVAVIYVGRKCLRGK